MGKDIGHIKKGDVVYVPFPFVDKDQTGKTADGKADDKQETEKDRPAVVLFQSDIDTFVICLITKQPHREHKIKLNGRDLDSGKINYDPSYIRPNIITTTSKNLIRSKVGTLKPDKMAEITEAVKGFLDKDPEPAPISKALERPKGKRIF